MRFRMRKLVLATSAAVVALSLWAATGLARPAAPNNTANMSCGDPTKDGTLTVVVTVEKGGTKTNVTWNVAIAATDDANAKATKIRAAGPGASDKINAPAGAANVVSVTAKNDWEITGIGITNDTTGEKAAFNVFAALASDHVGLCSIIGTATASGTVEVIVFGITATVNVTNGMTAAQIEDALIASLSGASARLVTGSDQIATYFPGLEGDAREILIPRIDSGGLSVEVVNADGISMDVGALVNPWEAGLPGLEGWGVVVLLIGLLLVGALFLRRSRAFAA